MGSCGLIENGSEMGLRSASKPHFFMILDLSFVDRFLISRPSASASATRVPVCSARGRTFSQVGQAQAQGVIMMASIVQREIERLEGRLRSVERYMIEARNLRDRARLRNDADLVARYQAALDHGLEKWILLHDVLVLLPLDVRTWPE